MFKDHKMEDIYLKNYYENRIRKKNESRDTSSKKANKLFPEDTIERYNIHFFIVSIAFNLIYFSHQILFFRIDDGIPTFFYTTLGLASAYIIILLLSLLLKIRKVYNPNLKILTSLSFSTIYIQILVVIFISFFMRGDSDSQRNMSQTTIIFSKFPFDFYLILCGSLGILSGELKFIRKHKIFIIFYFIVTIVMVLFISIIKNDFFILMISLSLLVLLFLIFLFNLMKENYLKQMLVESREDSRNFFTNYLSITKALNVGVFIFRNDDLSFSNEIGAKILSYAPGLGSSKFRNLSPNFYACITEMRLTPQADPRISGTDSVLILNEKQNLDNPSRRSSSTAILEKEKYRFIFKNIYLCDDTSNLKEVLKKCRYNSRDKRKSPTEENDDRNINPDSEERLNLHAIFRFLLNSKSHCHAESNCHCISHFKDEVNLGFFEIEFEKGKKTNYEIIVKLDNNISKEITSEFIFKDVTTYYDLKREMEEKNIFLKKSLHEFKTPIFSLLGCVEELKSRLRMIEDFLPENERIEILNYLEHVTNLGSYITYLVKGLTVSNKQATTKTIVLKTIKLNSLLKFCFSILQSLLSCDSEKLKNVRAEIKNKINDADVSFKSDDVQVKQILLNFISNAVKFTNFGKIILSAKLKRGIRGQFLKIKLKDTGCGVKNEDKTKLFQQYSKLNDTKNNSFGTGLGLNICKTMAEDLKMKIKFNSEEKKGTKVTLYVFNPYIKLVRANHFLDVSSQNEGINSKSIFYSETGPLQRSLTTNNKSKFYSESVVIQKSYTKLLENVCSDAIPRYNSLKPNRTKTSVIHEVDENEEEDRLIKTNSFRNQGGLSHQVTIPRSINTNLNYSELPYFKSHESDLKEFQANHINRKSTKLLDKYHSYDKTSHIQLLQSDSEPRNNQNYVVRINDSNENDLILVTNPIITNPKTSAVSQNKLNYTLSNANAFKKRKLSTSKNAILSKIRTVDPSETIVSDKPKIIIVDDQLHSRRALINLINLHFADKVESYELIEECDGIDCLKTVIKFPNSVKCILMDENMNFMNGSETAEIVGKLYSIGKISKIKLISTSADENLKDGARNSLYDLYVPKPLSQENIKKIFEII